jgi:hypothetical protein
MTLSPNPANESTSIGFGLSQTSRIELAVFNINGKKVKTLLNGERPAGSHQIQINVSDFPNGVYFVVLQTGFDKQVRKLVVY